MISFDEALARLLGAVHPLGAERVALHEAEGRVLAEDLRAATPLPPFDHSSMDGYALATSALAGDRPWQLPVAGESSAGGALPDLVSGTACRIFTGARLPAGADAVVMQEKVVRSGDEISLSTKPRPFENVRRAGEDLELGAVAIARGSRLTPGRIALAAALDRAEILVARRPVVSILATGDELRAPGTVHPPPRPGSIPESNAYFVSAAARSAGAIVRVAPFVPDELGAATRAVRDASRTSDAVVTVGGVSVGDRDVMRTALEGAGIALDFWRVSIKPGKPLAVGRASTPSGAPLHVLGLPGNPASASLTFLLFGMPLLRRLQGDASPLPPRLRATLATTCKREPGRLEFMRARLEVQGGDLVATPTPNQSSGAVTSFAEADSLVVLPAETGTVEAGARVDVLRLADA